MDINGSVNAGELEFTVELDTDQVWTEIEAVSYTHLRAHET